LIAASLVVHGAHGGGEAEDDGMTRDIRGENKRERESRGRKSKEKQSE